MKIKRALLIADDNFDRDPRPNRIANFFIKNGYEVAVVSDSHPNSLSVYEYEKLPYKKRNVLSKISYKIFMALATFFLPSHKIVEKLLFHYLYEMPDLCPDVRYGDRGYSVVWVASIKLLPFAAEMCGQAKLVFDAREFYPLQYEDNVRFRLFDAPLAHYICLRYLERCDKIYTVSPGLASEYNVKYGVNCEVLLSVPDYLEEKAVSNKILTHKEPIKIVHHGNANKNRKIENMVNIVGPLGDQFELNFYLTGNQEVIRYVKNEASKYVNIKFHDPVELEGITKMLTQYDIGLYHLEPTGFNVRHCLPNKLFEYIQAGLAVVTGPSPDMAQIVYDHECGYVAEDFELSSLQSLLSRLTIDDINKAKKNSAIASVTLCFENESRKISEFMCSQSN